MQFKKIMVLAILIVSLLAISTVNAADNVTDDIGSANDELVNIVDADDSLKSNPKTFSQLNGLINDNNDNDVYLDGNYAFKPGTDNGFKQGIVVDRNVTIWGKGFTLDGNNAARIFNVKCRDVVFRDVVFVNGKATDYGGAINGECSVVNCTFIDNSARNGGAIYSNGNCDLINCVFSGNAAMYGGAVYTIWGNFFARECKFSLNSATEEIYYSTGGAIFLYESNCSLIDVQFDNNSAHDYGCAIEQDCWNESYFTAINCSFKNHVSGAQTVIVGNNSSFINCSFVNNHGAIRCNGLSNVSNCYFENNFMEYGGAIYLSEGYCYLTNCSFKNSIGNNSDALYCLRSNCFVKNCNFLNSDIRSQYNKGHALESAVINCSFINSANEATGSVFDCKFINSTTQSYGIITNCSFKDKSAVSTIINYEEGVFISWDCDVVNCSFTDSFCGCVKLIANCSFENNTVSSAVGLLGIAEVINCSFINNHARAISGDGTGLNVSIINCNFLNNSANKGGAVYLYSGEVVIRNCNFIGNRAINNDTYMDGGGGAVLLVDCLTTIDNCSFINNSKIGENKLDVNHGGAVSIEGVYFREISCSISNSNFVNNTGRNGGAIHSESSSLSVDNSTFVSNSAIGYYTSNDRIPFPYISSGGAISYCNGNFNVNNCTFEKNYADSYGSAIACSVANAVISNSIFSGNVAKGKNKTFFEITYTDKKDNHSSKHFGNSTVFFESVYGKNTIVIENCSEFIKNDERFKTTTILDTSEIEVIMAFNQNYNLIVTFKKPNRIELKGFDVSMKLDGNTYNFKTNSKGQFNKVIKLNPGKYNAIISYGGNNDYKKATLTVKFIVTKATPKLTASKKTFKKSVKTKKYTVTLKNNKNEVMKYTQVSLKVNKKTYKVKTNSKGQATFKITNLNKKGTFTAVVKYDGSKYYYSKTVKPKIIVK